MDALRRWWRKQRERWERRDREAYAAVEARRYGFVVYPVAPGTEDAINPYIALGLFPEPQRPQGP